MSDMEMEEALSAFFENYYARGGTPLDDDRRGIFDAGFHAGWYSKSIEKKPGCAYGCHLELEGDMQPDGCVIDDGHPDDCYVARDLVRQGKGRNACPYWRPIQKVIK